MKATSLMSAQSVLSGMLNRVIAERVQENYPSAESEAQRDGLTVALQLIDAELSAKLEDEGANEVVRQYNAGLITLNGLCNKIVEIATTLK